MQSGIYVITNMKNLKCYVGSSVNVRKRFKEHKRDLKGNYHCNSYLQNAWNKYGEEAFVFEQVEDCPIDQLLIREQFWIDDMRVFELGYNLTPTAGNMLGFRHSEEAKKRMAEISRARTHSEEAKKKISEGNRGKIVSEDTKRKISESRRGKTHSEETKKKIGKSGCGRTHSEETKKKIGEGNRGKIVSEETKKKMSEKIISAETRRKLSEINRGKTLSEETKRKVSESTRGERNPNYGKTHSPETRQKISEAKKRYFANLKNQ